MQWSLESHKYIMLENKREWKPDKTRLTDSSPLTSKIIRSMVFIALMLVG
jgi:hypothetical protein